MSTPRLNVLVYGATGSQQNPVVHQLLRAGHHPTAVSHTPAKTEPLRQAGARVVIADMAQADQLRRASQGQAQPALEIFRAI